MDNNPVEEQVVVAIKVLTNEEIHLKKFNEYFYQNYESINYSRSKVVTKAVNARVAVKLKLILVKDLKKNERPTVT